MTLKAIWMILPALVGLVAVFGWKLTARGAYESAEYTVIESDREFEIREYPDLMVATTSMQFKRQGEDGSFMRLFRYIAGGNEANQKVAMTTPVFMQPDSDQVEGKMAFVIPKEVAARGTPEPVDEKVAVQKRAGGRFAVIRFAGRLNPETFANSERKLRQWMATEGYTAASSAESAGYDPPWTPGPLRRNEILIRLK